MVLIFLEMMSYVFPHIGILIYMIFISVACGYLMEVARNLRVKLNLAEGDQCCDCCETWWCLLCKTCQLGRELEDVQNPIVRELVLNVQKASPFSTPCMVAKIVQ